MKFALKELLNKILSRIIYYDREREVLSADISVSATTTGNYTSSTLLTLKANSRYLLLGYGNCSDGNARQYFSSFAVTANSGTQKHLVSTANQPYASSGAGHNFQAYVETGDSTLGIGVNSYKYATGYTLYWHVYAIEL